MNEYLNKTCGQCGEVFTENDDIAVCPDCGTPIHRSCWNGECPNREKHGTFDWESDGGNTPDKPVIDKRYCAICGEPMGDRPVVCQDCGAHMHFGCYMKRGDCPYAEHHDEMENDEEYHESGLNVMYVNSENSFAEKIKKHPLRDIITGEPLTCHGVTQSELLYFLGQHYISTPRYMGIFMRMALTKRKIFFNLWQGLLMPFYQFYQKMIGPGIILTILTFILDIPAMIWNTRLMAEATASSEPVISQNLAEIITICSVIGIIVQILGALFGDYLYMRWTVSKILTLREKCKDLPEEEYYAVLEKKGNPRWSFALLGVGISFCLTFILTYFIL